MDAERQHKKWYYYIATLGCVGHIGRAPGTNGTAVALLIHLLLGNISPLLLIATLLVGTIASDLYSRDLAEEDPGEVIIDEVAGYFVSVLFLPASYAFVAFLLFRIVDIIKPFPVNKMEKLPGGYGIMADDVCAGVIVNLLMRLIQWLFFAGGVEMIRQWFL